MARSRRCDVVDESTVGVYHCINRCVQQAFLCGYDRASGNNYDHRKGWIRERLEFLATIFAIDIFGFAVLSNHLHVLLRNRPDIATKWSDDEVARRWWNLCPRRKDEHGNAAEPTDAELQTLVSKPDEVAELRRRLSSISWFMRFLCEPIARRANQETGTSGRFFAGRFKSIRLLDEMAVLACMIYVDLNPIRAAIASSPEFSEFTSAFERIHAERQRAEQQQDGQQQTEQQSLSLSPSSESPPPSAQVASSARRIRAEIPPNDDWLSPIFVAEDAANPPTGRRASDEPCLTMRLQDYLRLLDWTGRQVRADKRGAMPAELAPILERLSLAKDHWVDLIQNFGRYFRQAAGHPRHLAEEAARRGRRWLHGISHARQACC